MSNAAKSFNIIQAVLASYIIILVEIIFIYPN